MIIAFDVQNFGSVKERQRLSFEAEKSDHLEEYYVVEAVRGLRLLKLGLIYGANASGKTTVLKALSFLRELVLNPEEKKTDELNFSPFLFDPLTPKQNSILSIEFLQNDIRYYYEVEFNRKAIVKERLDYYNPTKANIFKRDTDLDNEFSRITFGSKIKMDKASEKTLASNTLWNNTVLGGFLKTNIDFKALKDVVDWFRKNMRSIIVSETGLDSYVTSRLDSAEIDKSILISILQKADFNISDILLKDGKEMSERALKIFTALELSDDMIEGMKQRKRKEIEFEHTVMGAKYFLPFKAESQGTQRYYGFAGLLSLLIGRQTVAPIDEIESSLHPDLFFHFILAFLVNSKRSQIIATTHNREVLNNRDLFRNDAIWFTDKTENCATELYSLADFDSSVIRDTSNVYNAYKIGKLGGVPNLGDYYISMRNEKK